MKPGLSFRTLIAVILLVLGTHTCAQQIDSVHVFRDFPEGNYTSASANTMVWRLYHDHAAHVSIRGADVERIAEALIGHQPQFHRSGKLEDLTYLAMAFVNGRPVALGITGNLDRVINFPANKEFPVHAWPEQEQLRATFAELLSGP